MTQTKREQPLHSDRDSAPLLTIAIIVICMALAALGRARGAETPETAFAKRPLPRESAAALALRDGDGIDLNTASAADLQLLPRIGPALSARILDARPFRTVDDLTRVRGIGDRTLVRLRPLVRVSPPE